MLNKLSAFLRQQQVKPETKIVAAVSGGADSVALLFGLYLLKDIFHFDLSAAHFNHHLRGAESDRDEDFVRSFCDRYEIPLTVGHGNVTPGKKGLEAAAREARYAFLRELPGLIATAHTADDNAETLLMHLIRGSGLKGLGGIMPVNGNVIRPMLNVTRQEVEAFLEEYFLTHVEDSSNESDRFLRNRIRHQILPLFRAENPGFSLGASRLAQRLRQDEEWIASMMQPEMPGVEALRKLHPALRSRYLERFLKESGIPEPEQSHIAAAEALIFSPKPSAKANLPGGKTIARNYDRLVLEQIVDQPEEVFLEGFGTWELPQWGIRLSCLTAQTQENGADAVTAAVTGAIHVRSRLPGDAMRLPGGTRLVKKAMIDRKIPAGERSRIPVIADEQGILLVAGLGANLDRVVKELPAVCVRIEKIEK